MRNSQWWCVPEIGCYASLVNVACPCLKGAQLTPATGSARARRWSLPASMPLTVASNARNCSGIQARSLGAAMINGFMVLWLVVALVNVAQLAGEGWRWSAW